MTYFRNRAFYNLVQNTSYAAYSPNFPKPYSLAIDFGPSNGEINVRYWETYWILLGRIYGSATWCGLFGLPRMSGYATVSLVIIPLIHQDVFLSPQLGVCRKHWFQLVLEYSQTSMHQLQPGLPKQNLKASIASPVARMRRILYTFFYVC